MAARHAVPGNRKLRAVGCHLALAVGCLLTSAAALAGNNQLCDNGDGNISESFGADLMRADDEVSALDPAKPRIAEERVSDKGRLSAAIEATLLDDDEPRPSSLESEPVNLPLTTRVPGLSDDAMARYKRYMYRKDI